MGGYRIGDLNKDTIELIRKYNIDKNNDGLINDNNNELSELLSRTGKSEIHALVKSSNIKHTIMGTGALTIGSKFLGDYFTKKASNASISFSEIMKEANIEMLGCIERANLLQQITCRKYPIPKIKNKYQAFSGVLKSRLNSIKNQKNAAKYLKWAAIGLGAATAIMSFAYLLGKEYVTYEKDHG